MHTVIVTIRVEPGRIDEFVKETLENVRATLKEPGVMRFDLLREAEDPSRFLLVEVYRHAEDQVSHKETAHYKRWAAEVETLLAEPRTRKIYHTLSPMDSGRE